jgi:hypothetical protein
MDQRAPSKQAIEHGGSERSLQLLGDIGQKRPAAIVGFHLEVEERLRAIVDHAGRNLTDVFGASIVE